MLIPDHIHPIPPGLWCGPAALTCITGDDWQTVIHPALNRHMNGESLTAMVVGSTWTAMLEVLKERGYRTRRYLSKPGAPLRAHVATWARRSIERYPGRVFLVHVPKHVMVITDGRVFDTWTPHGAQGAEHPYSKTTVDTLMLVEKK